MSAKPDLAVQIFGWGFNLQNRKENTMAWCEAFHFPPLDVITIVPVIRYKPYHSSLNFLKTHNVVKPCQILGDVYFRTKPKCAVFINTVNCHESFEFDNFRTCGTAPTAPYSTNSTCYCSSLYQLCHIISQCTTALFPIIDETLLLQMINSTCRKKSRKLRF